jgi:hypothetical protein
MRSQPSGNKQPEGWSAVPQYQWPKVGHRQPPFGLSLAQDPFFSAHGVGFASAGLAGLSAFLGIRRARKLEEGRSGLELEH